MNETLQLSHALLRRALVREARPFEGLRFWLSQRKFFYRALCSLITHPVESPTQLNLSTVPMVKDVESIANPKLIAYRSTPLDVTLDVILWRIKHIIFDSCFSATQAISRHYNFGTRVWPVCKPRTKQMQACPQRRHARQRCLHDAARRFRVGSGMRQIQRSALNILTSWTGKLSLELPLHQLYHTPRLCVVVLSLPQSLF